MQFTTADHFLAAIRPKPFHLPGIKLEHEPPRPAQVSVLVPYQYSPKALPKAPKVPRLPRSGLRGCQDDSPWAGCVFLRELDRFHPSPNLDLPRMSIF